MPPRFARSTRGESSRIAPSAMRDDDRARRSMLTSPAPLLMRIEEDAYPASHDLDASCVIRSLGHKGGKMESQAYHQPARDTLVAARPHLVRHWSSPGILLVLTVLAVALAGCDLGSSSTQPGARTAGAPAPTVAVPASAQDLQQTVINVIHTVQPSVVEVKSQGGGGGAIGSGENLTNDGYIVTNDHVVEGFSSFSVVLSNGKTAP